MKHSIAVKFLAVILTACALVSVVAGTVGIIAIERAGLYVNSLDDLQVHEYETIARTIARDYTNLYAVKSFGSIPYTLRTELYSDPTQRSDSDAWFIRLYQKDSVVSEFGASYATEHFAAIEEFIFTPLYPIVSLKSPSELEEESSSLDADTDKPHDDAKGSPLLDPQVPENYLYYNQQTRFNGGKLVTYYLYYYEAPEYTAQVFLQEKVLNSSSLHILTSLYPYRYACIAVLALGIILFCAGLVSLLWSAGATKDGSISPCNLNRMPIDLYFLLCAFGIYLLSLLLKYLLDWMQSHGPHPGNLSLITANLFVIVLPVIGFLYAFAAQLKLEEHYLWHNTLLYRCALKIGQGIRFLWRGAYRIFTLLPLVWQWLATVLIMAAVIVTLCMLSANGNALAWFLLVLAILFCGGIVFYGAYAFGSLLSGVHQICNSNPSHKISTKYLHGSYRQLAQELNTLSETVRLAAEHEMRSERMKSELITNVSHDIKTPLTSIINFVDLLQKPHTADQQSEYLDVLSRQSNRLKKLIEDLIELSKASTGNITVNITQIDATETVNQALGEFSDKLESAGLIAVFQAPDTPIKIRADGRLVWRVLSNLLSNAVKYALPGTRLYIDLSQVEDRVLLSLKNVSREALTIHADELLERFVQGDTSRNSEGSGLGLNIAKNLMEVQHGKMQLLLDGDLFKVTLIFPAN